MAKRKNRYVVSWTDGDTIAGYSQKHIQPMTRDQVKETIVVNMGYKPKIYKLVEVEK